MQSVSSNYLVQTSTKVRQKMEFSSGVSPEAATSGTTKVQMWLNFVWDLVFHVKSCTRVLNIITLWQMFSHKTFRELTLPNTCFRRTHPEVFLLKGILKICSKLTGEHTCRSVISIKLLCSFIEISLRHGCSLVNLLHNLRTPFPMNTSGLLLLLLGQWRFG